MSLRSPAERALQTLAYEATGLLLAVPLYRLISGAGVGEGTAMMLALTFAVLTWSAFHNSVFDWLELRLTGRVASDRPAGMRLVQALSQEGTALVVSLPLMLTLGGLTVAEALMANVGLTLLYVGHALVFHRVWDWWRPVVVAMPGAVPGAGAGSGIPTHAVAPV